MIQRNISSRKMQNLDMSNTYQAFTRSLLHTYVSVLKRNEWERFRRETNEEILINIVQLNQNWLVNLTSSFSFARSCCLSIFINADLYPTNILLSSIYNDILNQQTTPMTTLLFFFFSRRLFLCFHHLLFYHSVTDYCSLEDIADSSTGNFSSSIS